MGKIRDNLDAKTIQRIAELYKKGTKIKDITTKFGIVSNSITYHRNEALKIGDDWLAIRKQTNNILKNSADNQDEQTERHLELAEIFVEKIELMLKKDTKTIFVKNESGGDLEEIPLSPDDYGKLGNLLNQVFGIKIKYITNRIRGDKESLISGARIFSELLVPFIKNKLKDGENTITIDQISEIMPDVVIEVERNIGK